MNFSFLVAVYIQLVISFEKLNKFAAFYGFTYIEFYDVKFMLLFQSIVTQPSVLTMSFETCMVPSSCLPQETYLYYVYWQTNVPIEINTCRVQVRGLMGRKILSSL